MQLHKSEWLDIAQRLAIGRTVRVQHKGCSRRANLVITHSATSYWAYCHACKGHGSEHKTHVRFTPDLNTPRRYAEPPSDVISLQAYNTTEYKGKALLRRAVQHLHDKGVSIVMLNNLGITCKVSLGTNRLVLYHAGQAILGRDLTGASNAKWCEYRGCPDMILFKVDLMQKRTLVLTEDLYSAVKVKFAASEFGIPVSTGTITGTSITTKVLDNIVKLDPKQVLLFFDGDSAGIRGAYNVAKRLRVFFGVPRVHYTTAPTGLDPKDLSAESIHEILTPYLDLEKEIQPCD